MIAKAFTVIAILLAFGIYLAIRHANKVAGRVIVIEPAWKCAEIVGGTDAGCDWSKPRPPLVSRMPEPRGM